MQPNVFESLSVTIAHTEQVALLTFHHRDPFDRMLTAQAMVEQVPIISVDSVFDQYPVVRVW
jgi:PIN domain nuclease of toxin-antitoxin system